MYPTHLRMQYYSEQAPSVPIYCDLIVFQLHNYEIVWFWWNTIVAIAA